MDWGWFLWLQSILDGVRLFKSANSSPGYRITFGAKWMELKLQQREAELFSTLEQSYSPQEKRYDSLLIITMIRYDSWFHILNWKGIDDYYERGTIWICCSMPSVIPFFDGMRAYQHMLPKPSPLLTEAKWLVILIIYFRRRSPPPGGAIRRVLFFYCAATLASRYDGHWLGGEVDTA